MVLVKGTGGKTGKDLLFQVKLASYKKAFPGVSEAKALAFANGDISLGDDPKIRATYYKIASDIIRDGTDVMSVKDKQILLDQMVTDMMGGQGNPRLRKANENAPRRTSGVDQNNPAQVATQAEFDALPSGAYFINPADGKLRQKN